MIYIFDREEQLSAVLDNANKGACPILSASFEEVLNGESILEFTVPFNHSAVSKIIENGYAAIKKENGEFEVFIINNIEDAHENKLEKNITCHHAIRELEDDFIEELLIDRKDAPTALTAILAATRFTLGTADADLNEIHDLTVRRGNALEALQTFIDRWNVEVSYRFEFSGGRINKRIIDLHKQRGSDNGRRFEFEKDLTSFTKTINTQGLKTALYGFATVGVTTNAATGEGEETLIDFSSITWSKANGDPYDKPLGQTYIENTEARNKYGRLNADGTRRNLWGVHIGQKQAAADGQNDMTADELILETSDLLTEISKPRIMYEGKVLDYAKITSTKYNSISLGDTTGLIDRELDEFVKARIIKYKRDLLNKENNDITLGNFVPTLTEDTNKTIAAAEEAQRAANLANFKADNPEIIKEGDTIKTDWLEDEINLLTKKIRSGEGTVTIDNNNGILIEDIDRDANGNIIARRGALQLKGGMLSLADTYDAAIGDYNWRAFGTGEGFLADLVQTGFLKFDRSQGGTLTLGGENNENGTLIVHGDTLDGSGNPIETVVLTGSKGGFDRLSIGELTNTTSTNIITRLTDTFKPELQDTNKNLNYYIDPVNGDDNNIGTIAAPRRTVQSCLDELPKYLDRNVTFYCLPTLLADTFIDVEGFIGEGYIYFKLWDVGASTRYIRDFMEGSTANNSNHWVEVGGYRGTGTWTHAGGNTYPNRITLHDAATGADITAEMTNPGYASNGDTATASYASHNIATKRHVYTETYLGGVYDLSELRIYHYYGDGRTYYKTKTQISENKTDWYTVFDSDRQGTYAETSSGKQILLKYALLNGRITVRGCLAKVYIYNMFVNSKGIGTPLYLERTFFVESRDSVYFGDEGVSYVVYSYGSNARLINCETNISNHSSICAAYGGMIQVHDVKGSGSKYGLFAHSTGHINGGLASPVGSSANYLSSYGGRYEGTWTPTSGVHYQAPIVEKTDTWTANDTHSAWQKGDGTWDWASDYIYQGKRPTDTPVWYGVIFFNAADFSALANRSIKKVRLKLQRTNNTGEDTTRYPKIYYNLQTSASGAVKTLSGGWINSTGFRWGEEKWITLSNTIGEAFRDGTAESIVLHYQSNETNYMRFEAKATLEITHG